MDLKNQNVLKVYRTKARAKNNYNKISHFYDFLTGGFESHFRKMDSAQLNIKSKDKLKPFGLPLEIVSGQYIT